MVCCQFSYMRANWSSLLSSADVLILTGQTGVFRMLSVFIVHAHAGYRKCAKTGEHLQIARKPSVRIQLDSLTSIGANRQRLHPSWWVWVARLGRRLARCEGAVAVVEWNLHHKDLKEFPVKILSLMKMNTHSRIVGKTAVTSRSIFFGAGLNKSFMVKEETAK